MSQLNATELAARLGLSKARISQYVAEGKLEGCFTGDGRARRFDLGRVATALGHRLDLGQMLGNGAETRRALKDAAIEPALLPTLPLAPPAPRKAAPPLPPDVIEEPSRYDLARIQIAEEDARRKRRDNERDEGRWVLAEEVARESAKQLGQELAKFEIALRDGARDVADQFGIDFREVRQVLMRQWRAHRGARAQALAQDAEACQTSEAEKEADI